MSRQPTGPVDHRFLATAPVRGVAWQHLPVDRATAFRCLSDADAWPRWLSSVRSAAWDPAAPPGPGARRSVVMRIGPFEEEFFDWDAAGTRFAFRVTAAPLPGLAAMAEEWALFDAGDDACDLRWTWALACGPGWRWLQRGYGWVVGSSTDRTLPPLAAHLAADGDRYRASSST